MKRKQLFFDTHEALVKQYITEFDEKHKINVHILVQYLITKYYCPVEFAKDASPEYFKLSFTGQTIATIKQHWELQEKIVMKYNIYPRCKKVISWKFEIKKLTQDQEMTFGITTQNELGRAISSFYVNSFGCYYSDDYSHENGYDQRVEWIEGAVVTLIFDGDSREFSFEDDKNNRVSLFKNVFSSKAVEACFVIFLPHLGDCVSLIDFVIR